MDGEGEMIVLVQQRICNLSNLSNKDSSNVVPTFF